ncbi:MAG: hypothetical protein U9O94_10745, partial [Nanoarchaeota archaeon]|nr:hypothetical protein [Nanoarchaeota archaeon]
PKPKPKPKKVEPVEVVEEEIMVEVAVEIEPEPKEKPKPKPKPKERERIKLPGGEMQVVEDLINNIDPDDLDNTPVFQFGKNRKTKNSSYDFSDKVRAVLIMRAFSFDNNGKLVPNILGVERLTGINSKTLKAWWSQRAEIIGSSTSVVSEIQNIVLYELSLVLLKATTLIKNRLDYNGDKEKTENLIRIVDKVVNKLAIIGGMPTQRKRVDHHHHLPVQALPPADAD